MGYTRDEAESMADFMEQYDVGGMIAIDHKTGRKSIKISPKERPTITVWLNQSPTTMDEVDF